MHKNAEEKPKTKVKHLNRTTKPNNHKKKKKKENGTTMDKRYKLALKCNEKMKERRELVDGSTTSDIIA